MLSGEASNRRVLDSLRSQLGLSSSNADDADDADDDTEDIGGGDDDDDDDEDASDEEEEEVDSPAARAAASRKRMLQRMRAAEAEAEAEDEGLALDQAEEEDQEGQEDEDEEGEEGQGEEAEVHDAVEARLMRLADPVAERRAQKRARAQRLAVSGLESGSQVVTSLKRQLQRQVFSFLFSAGLVLCCVDVLTCRLSLNMLNTCTALSRSGAGRRQPGAAACASGRVCRFENAARGHAGAAERPGRVAERTRWRQPHHDQVSTSQPASHPRPPEHALTEWQSGRSEVYITTKTTEMRGGRNPTRGYAGTAKEAAQQHRTRY